jgi:hypothetical protein
MLRRRRHEHNSGISHRRLDNRVRSGLTLSTAAVPCLFTGGRVDRERPID